MAAQQQKQSTYVSNWKRALERFSTPQALTKSKLRGRAEARGMVSEAWVAMLMEFGGTQVTGEGRKPREPAEKVLVGGRSRAGEQVARLLSGEAGAVCVGCRRRSRGCI